MGLNAKRIVDLLHPDYHETVCRLAEEWVADGMGDGLRGLIFRAIDHVLRTTEPDDRPEWLEDDPDGRRTSKTLFNDIKDHITYISDIDGSDQGWNE